MSNKSIKRRDFLKLLGLGTGSALALELLSKVKTGLARSSKSNPNEEGRSWAMVIDQEKCIGCGYCIKACRASNDIPPSITWTKLYEVEQIGDKTVYLSVPCMHCEHAPCVSVCPVGASYYREDGIVMMDYDLCIGCRYCQTACPYQARSFNWEAFTGDNPAVPEWGEPDVERRPRGVVEKCTFCYQRIDRGLAAGLVPGVDPEATPACVNACPQSARIFGDINDPESPVSIALANNPSFRLREDIGTGPRVYYLPPDREPKEVS
jgi:phenylacetyl-CoA:acceptor oxidoreductase subunit 1